MNTCRIVATLVTCVLDPTRPASPVDAVAILTASVPPWTAPPSPTIRAEGPAYDPDAWRRWPSFAPTSAPTAPLAPPWSMTVYTGHRDRDHSRTGPTTHVGKR